MPVPEPSVAIIKLSEKELESGQISSYNLEKALVGFEKDGMFVIENGLNPDCLDKLNARMVPEAEKLFLDEKTHRNFGKDTGNIQQEPVPLPEYLFEDVIANKFVSQVTECILGPNPVVRFYSANTAFKATSRQPVHIDCEFEFKDHCFGICVNINLVSTTPENGATELWPGSHRHAKRVQGEDISAEQIELVRDTIGPVQLSLPKGAIIVRDFRLWHAGMPNQTDTPRVMLVTVQFPHWYRSELKFRLAESCRPIMSEMNKKLQYAVEYFPDDEDYLKGAHDHTFAQTY